MKIRVTLALFILGVSSLAAGSFDKIIKKIIRGEMAPAYALLSEQVPDAKTNYFNVKDSLQEKKQRTKADEYAALLLLKGFVGLRVADPAAESDLKLLTVFYDPYSTNQHMFKAFAWKLLYPVYELAGNLTQMENCRKKWKEEWENFENLGQENEYKEILEGILGGLD